MRRVPATPPPNSWRDPDKDRAKAYALWGGDFGKVPGEQQACMRGD